MKDQSELMDSGFAEEFPQSESTVEQWKFLLRKAVLAPSLYNSQPWQFRIGYTYVELYADKTRLAPVADPLNRNLMLSCGCVIFHLRCIMQYYKCLGPIEIFPSDHADLIARIHMGMGGESTEGWTELFEAIPKRRTCRWAFEEDPISSELVAQIETDASAEGAWLRSFTSDSEKLQVAQVIHEADHIQWSNPEFREELNKWVHTNHRLRNDGIPDYALPDDDLFSYPMPEVQRHFETEAEPTVYRDIANASPVLAVLATQGDLRINWVASGQALDRVVLRAAAEGVSGSFLNQPVGFAESRRKLVKLCGRFGFPQAVFRLGRCRSVKPTPRRPLEEMLI